MKELTIEQKAQRYDEAIKVAKNNYETIVQMDKDCTFAKEGIVNTFHHMFPELKEKESEDEKIREQVVYAINQLHVCECTKNKLIAWVKKQGEQNPAWSEEDEYVFNKVLNWVLIVNPTSSIFEKLPKEQFIERFKSIRPQINVTDEELAQAKKEAYNDALDKIEYHSGEPTFDDGWSAAIWYLKKRNAQPQSTWKPSDEQIKALNRAMYHVEDDVATQIAKLIGDLKKLREKRYETLHT